MLRRGLPFLATLAAVVVGLALAHLVLIRRAAPGRERGVAAHLVMLALTGVALVALVLALPVETDTRGQLLSLLGLVLTAVIALASTTFVSNAMAGLMLRAVGNFRPGDFVRVGEHFGRVTERGLFHIEVQSEDRDLMTLPNLYLVTQPVTVVRESGTVVSCQVGIGYDVAHDAVEARLLDAAAAAGLDDAFVQIVDLGDFAVTYRVAGFLGRVRRLLSARSRLRAAVLDALHGADVEIVSPTFMNQRRVDDRRFVPPVTPGRRRSASAGETPEALVFDKAERAEHIEGLRRTLADLEQEHADLARSLKSVDDEAERRRGEARLAELERRIQAARARSDALSKQDES